MILGGNSFYGFFFFFFFWGGYVQKSKGVWFFVGLFGFACWVICWFISKLRPLREYDSAGVLKQILVDLCFFSFLG